MNQARERLATLPLGRRGLIICMFLLLLILYLLTSPVSTQPDTVTPENMAPKFLPIPDSEEIVTVEALLTAPIFHQNRQFWVAAVARPAPKPLLPLPRASFAGYLASPQGGGRVFLKSNAETSAVRQGDEFQGWRIIETAPTYVVLEHKNRQCRIDRQGVEALPDKPVSKQKNDSEG